VKERQSGAFYNLSLNVDQSLKEDLKAFLRVEREVKTYSEKGEINKRIIVFNETYDTILSKIKKDKEESEVKESMKIKDMESCVRSCSSKAFSNAKGFFDFFTKSIITNN